VVAEKVMVEDDQVAVLEIRLQNLSHLLEKDLQSLVVRMHLRIDSEKEKELLVFRIEGV
jgi:hypothetical protein